MSVGIYKSTLWILLACHRIPHHRLLIKTIMLVFRLRLVLYGDQFSSVCAKCDRQLHNDISQFVSNKLDILFGDDLHGAHKLYFNHLVYHQECSSNILSNFSKIFIYRDLGRSGLAMF